MSDPKWLIRDKASLKEMFRGLRENSIEPNICSLLRMVERAHAKIDELKEKA